MAYAIDDVLAHLTCPLRYINGKYKRNVSSRRYEEKIIEILKYIIENAIAMEINTSGIGNGFLMPDEWIIKKFKDMDGYLVTLGSDTHMSQNVGNGFGEVLEILKEYGFAGVVTEVGENVRDIAVGDRVCVDPNKLCGECYYCKNAIGHFCENMIGIGTTVNGGFEQYVANNTGY